ncbi:MAG: DUF4870 domain-containing protein [Candidatus Calescibacterium sp.]|nr:DUF4870 domain-containing protein [Candidatus Calescibacterium sp.]MCX7972582.1 DUF4870 domain-containing protein [bacterium]MDW8195783.1 DUF4870 domain-containing protein [Candidatus Calescibacterium sp.]
MNTSLGIQDNILAAVGYIIPVIAMIVYFVEKENNFLKFHCLQSIILSMIVIAIFSIISSIICFLQFIPAVGSILSCVFLLFLIPIVLVIFLIAIFLAVKAYNREYYKIPYIGDQVEKIIYKY